MQKRQHKHVYVAIMCPAPGSQKDGIGAEKGGHPEPGDLVIGRLMKKAIKSEAHG